MRAANLNESRRAAASSSIRYCQQSSCFPILAIHPPKSPESNPPQSSPGGAPATLWHQLPGSPSPLSTRTHLQQARPRPSSTHRPILLQPFLRRHFRRAVERFRREEAEVLCAQVQRWAAHCSREGRQGREGLVGGTYLGSWER